MGKRYIKINENDAAIYSPPGHGDTYNRRLLGPKEGSDRLEFIIGRMGRNGNAEAHVHGSFDQVMFMLEGRIRVTGDGPEVTLEKGDLIYFPVGCSHKVEVETEEAKFLVLYTPPREASAEAVNAG